MLAPVFSLAILLSCSGNSYTIPKQDSAAKQLARAVRAEQNYLSPIQKAKRKERAERAIAAYQKVLDEYPEETQIVQRAELRIAIIHQRQGRLRKAMKILKRLLVEAADDPRVQIYSLLGIAQIHDVRREYAEAQEYYGKIVERYGKHTTRDFQNVVRESRRLYQQIRRR